MKHRVVLIQDDAVHEALAMQAVRRVCPCASIIIARNAVEALRRVVPSSTEPCHAPHLVVVDHELPDSDGIEMVRCIRQASGARFTPVVMLSKTPCPTLVNACYGVGVNSFIVEPKDNVEYVNLLAEAVRYWLHTNISLSD